jgi:hypothetical protein
MEIQFFSRKVKIYRRYDLTFWLWIYNSECN